jgi:hypothetical protein
MSLSTLGRMALGTTAGVTLVLGLAGAATAAPTGSVLPECATVTRDIGFLRQTVWVRNACSTEIRVSVVTSAARVSCFAVAAGKRNGWRFGKAYRYIRTELCD